MDVGQGNCVIIDCGDRDKLVVDCGSSQYPQDIPEKIPGVRSPSTLVSNPHRPAMLISKIKSALAPPSGIPNPSDRIVVVVSHPDDDHLDRLKDLFPVIAPKFLILGGPAGDYFKKSEARKLVARFIMSTHIIFLSHQKIDKEDIKSLLELNTVGEIDTYLEMKELRGHIMGKSLKEFLIAEGEDGIEDLRDFCPKLGTEILSANAGQIPPGIHNKAGRPFLYVFDPDDNTNSIVLKIMGEDGQSVILTGDATGITTDQIIKYYDNGTGHSPYLKTDVMMACHHGSGTHESNNEKWVKETSPASTIFSCATMHDHPACPIVDSYDWAAQQAGPLTGSIAPHFVSCGPSTDGIRNQKSMTSAVYSTYDSGTITATFEAGKIILKPQRSASFEIRKRLQSAEAEGGAVAMRTPLPSFRRDLSSGLSSRSPYSSSPSRGSRVLDARPGSVPHSLSSPPFSPLKSSGRPDDYSLFLESPAKQAPPPRKG